MAAAVGRRHRTSRRQSAELKGCIEEEDTRPPQPLPSPRGEPPERPLSQLGFQGARHLIPSRLPSARSERTVGLRVIDLNTETIASLKSVSNTLKRLDISGLDLESLSDEVVKSLKKLERLDASDNNISDEGLPASFSKLENLIEFSACSNKLKAIPKVLRKLKNLTRLKVGQNEITSTDGIERLRRLQILVLDDNKIDQISKELLSNLKRLEQLHLSNNLITELNTDIRLLRNLRDLDISGNQISSIPPELFLLPRLEVITASHNNISRLPTVNVKGHIKRKLAAIDLADNALIKFPEHLLMITEKLDLSRNNIKVIPGSLLKRLDWDTNQELLIANNPLTTPPAEICECGMKSIMQFFQESRADMKVYQGLKVLVLGDSGSGKTSLVQTLVDQQPRLTTPDEISHGVDLYELDLDMEPDEGEDPGPMGKSLHLSMWDFSGSPQYMYPNYAFLHQPSVVIITFNLAKYDVDETYSMLETWCEWVIQKTSRLALLAVGTHADKVPAKKAKNICQEFGEIVANVIASRRTNIENEIKKIESRPHISPSLSESLKHYMKLLKVEVIVHHQVIPISSKDMNGTEELLNALKDLAQNKTFFTNVLRTIPTLWADVETYVEDRGYSMPIPIIKWEEYVEEITEKFGMRHLIHQITQYMHETGKVVWYEGHPMLEKYVFLRPSWLTDLIKPIFRTDLDTVDYNMEENIKLCNMSMSKYEKLRLELQTEGALDKDLLKCLWAHLIPTDNSSMLMEIFQIFVEYFEFAYPQYKQAKDNRVSILEERDILTPLKRHSSKERLDGASSSRSRADSAISSIKSSSSHLPERSGSASTSRSSRSERSDSGIRTARSGSGMGTDRSDATKNNGVVGKLKKNSEETEAKTPSFRKCVIPWLRKSKQPRTFKDEYERYQMYPSLAAVFRFPRNIPPGFFEVMVVRALKKQHALNLIHHWDVGLYCRHTENPFRFYLLRINHDDGSTCIRLEVRHEEQIDIKDVETLWGTLLPYIKDVERMLATFAGLRVERYIECPKCRSLSFLGEWMTPKELQGLPHKQCEACKNDIDSVFLIQPKEKKRVEEFLLQKLMKESEKRRQNEQEAKQKENEKTENAEKEEAKQEQDQTVNNENESQENNVSNEGDSDQPDNASDSKACKTGDTTTSVSTENKRNKSGDDKSAKSDDSKPSKSGDKPTKAGDSKPSNSSDNTYNKVCASNPSESEDDRPTKSGSNNPLATGDYKPEN